MGAIFGPAGNSDSYRQKKDKIGLFDYLKSFNLKAYEYQCGRGVRISNEKAEEFGQSMIGIKLSLHAPYYISLSSVEKEKRDNSINYILQSAAAAKAMGADRVVVHSGSCSKISREKALELAKDTMKRAIEALKKEDLYDISICPETMGKINQLGTLDEVLTLCEIDENMIPCIDFGHLNARTYGGLKNQKDFEDVLYAIENRLGFDRLKSFHSHFSKIEYTFPGGEKRHLTFEDENYGPDFELLAELIAKKNLSPTFICESSGTQAEDAQKMQSIYNKFLNNK